LGNPRQTRRSHHLAAVGTAGRRPANPARESDHRGDHQHARQGRADCGGSDQGERVSQANQSDCGAVDARAAVEANSQRCVSSIPGWQGHRKPWSSRRCPRLTAVFRIKRHSVSRAAVIYITGIPCGHKNKRLSLGRVTIETSKDPVGAPIFYRDVPLMPSEVEKGVIKPLAPAAVPLIAWRLRNVGEPDSRLLLDNMPTCANCHSFSRDGKTLGMDLDGPKN